MNSPSQLPSRVSCRSMGTGNTSRCSAVTAYSQVEILVVLLLIAILTVISFTGYAKYKRHVEKAQCMSQMRAVHQGLASHVADKHYWPQPPMDVESVTEETWFGFWISVLEPYGVPAEAWMCPTDKVERGKEQVGKQGSYVPTVFDTGRYTPYRWNQPWLMERGNLHGKGAHIIFPRGEILSSQEIN